MEEGASTPLIKCKSERGEATVQDDNGASDFEALWSAMRWKPQSGDARRCSLYRREYIALGVNSPSTKAFGCARVAAMARYTELGVFEESS